MELAKDVCIGCGTLCPVAWWWRFELERMVVRKVLLVVRRAVTDSSTAQTNQLLSSRPAWSWPRKIKQTNM